MKCPDCHEELAFKPKLGGYRCPNANCANREVYPEEIYDFNPDMRVFLGKNKTHGKITLFINSNSCQFFFETTQSGFLFSAPSLWHGPYSLNDIIEFHVASNETIIYQTSKGFVPMVAGGMLFGSIGAVAGSMISNKTEKVSKDVTYTITFKIDDLKFPGISVDSREKDKVFNLVSLLELIKKRSEK